MKTLKLSGKMITAQTKTPTQHTPGPWFIETEHPANREQPHELNRNTAVATPCGLITQSGDSSARQRANARLISAAPELLTALKLCAKHANFANAPEDVEAAVDAAIAKAEGGA